RMLVSVRVPGSTIDQALPTHIEGPVTFRLSGTSEATAVTAGAAALLLAQDHQAGPDEVKALLTRTTTRIAGSSAGEVNVARALRAPVPTDAGQTARPANGFLKLLLGMGPQ